MNAYGLSSPGLCRTNNEDAFLSQPERGVFAVADGLGGLPYGEVASAEAVRCLAQSSDEDFHHPDRLVESVNQCVVLAGARLNCRIGTTLTLAVVTASGLLEVAQVGDSMAFLLRNGGELMSLTCEQTEGEARRSAGETDVDPFLDHVLTQCVGQGRGLRPAISSRPVALGDRILLCSDGVSKVLPKDRIGEIMRSASAPEVLARELIQAVMDAGAPDNATVVAVFP